MACFWAEQEDEAVAREDWTVEGEGVQEGFSWSKIGISDSNYVVKRILSPPMARLMKRDTVDAMGINGKEIWHKNGCSSYEWHERSDKNVKRGAMRMLKEQRKNQKKPGHNEA
jgi:hypothetical protein